jgi:hypothetical protein
VVSPATAVQTNDQTSAPTKITPRGYPLLRGVDFKSMAS